MLRRKYEIHMKFCALLYWEQVKGGRYCVHEHPTQAASWKVKCIEELANSVGVYKARAHQCAYGLTSTDKLGTAPATERAA